MKNVQKLQEVYTDLSMLRDLTTIYNLSAEATSVMQKCLNNLNGFMIDNISVQEKSKGGFSVWDIAKEKNKKDSQTYHAYVHYDHKEKVAVATDGYILYVSHKEYKPLSYCFKREGKNGSGDIVVEQVPCEMYDKYDNPVEGRYPTYRSVIPRDRSLTPITLASKEIILERVAKAKADFKLRGGSKPEENIMISVMGDDNYGLDRRLNPQTIKLKYIKAVLQLGVDGWSAYLGSDGQIDSFVKKFENGDIIMIMSCKTPLPDELGVDKVEYWHSKWDQYKI